MNLPILAVLLVSPVAMAKVPPAKGGVAAWTTSQGTDAPESVYYLPAERVFLVSNIGGEGTKKDGKGWIQKVSLTGKMLNPLWVTGLNGPKGMRAHKGTLWVSDIDEIVAIRLKDGKLLSKTPVPGAKFLNDVAVGRDGTVYVSDTIGGKIFTLKNGKVGTFVSGDELESPNGLLIRGDRLFVAAWGLTTDWSAKVPGRLYSLHLKTKKKTLITQKPLGNLDGLEFDHRGNYLVSDWAAGKVFRVTPGGRAKLILHGFQGSADIAYAPRARLLVVPRMKENQIDAFNLK